jgi:hypothetical protein
MARTGQVAIHGGDGSYARGSSFGHLGLILQPIQETTIIVPGTR